MNTNLMPTKPTTALRSLAPSELVQVDGGLGPAAAGVMIGLAVVASVEFYNNHANVRIMDRARATVGSQ